MVTRHSVFITHHLKYLIPFGTITHLSSLNIFQLFVGPIPVSCAAFTFFFFLQPPVPKLTEPSEKKKKKKTQKHEPSERRREKKKGRKN